MASCLCVCGSPPDHLCTYIHGSKLLKTAGEAEPAKLSKSQVTRGIEVIFIVVVWGLIDGGCWAGGVCVIFFKWNYTYTDHFFDSLYILKTKTNSSTHIQIQQRCLGKEKKLTMNQVRKALGKPEQEEEEEEEVSGRRH